MNTLPRQSYASLPSFKERLEAAQPSMSRTPLRSQGGLHEDYKVGRLPKHESHAIPSHT